MILDIGCGKNKTKYSLGLDKVKLEGVDIVHDLEVKPLPFGDNTFNTIIANHVLEHIENYFELMEELCRILKPNGILKIRVPYFRSVDSFTNPTHKRFFTAGSFLFFDKNFKENYYSKARFKVRKIKLAWLPMKLVGIFERYFSHWFPYKEIYFELVKE